MNIAAHSGLGRHLNLRYRSNRIAVFGTLLAAALLGGVTWTTSGEIDFFATASAAIGVFLAWAIARELDPDHPGSASIAMVAATLLALIQPPATAVVAVLLIAVRILVGTVGAPLRPGDLLVLMAAAGYAGSRPDGWAAAGALAIAVAVAHRRHRRWLPATLGGVALTTAIVASPGADIGLASPLSAVVITLAAAAAAVTPRPTTVDSTTDFADQSISADRVFAARSITALTLVATGLLGATATALAPGLAALAAISLRRLRPRHEHARRYRPLLTPAALPDIEPSADRSHGFGTRASRTTSAAHRRRTGRGRLFAAQRHGRREH